MSIHECEWILSRSSPLGMLPCCIICFMYFSSDWVSTAWLLVLTVSHSTSVVRYKPAGREHAGTQPSPYQFAQVCQKRPTPFTKSLFCLPKAVSSVLTIEIRALLCYHHAVSHCPVSQSRRLWLNQVVSFSEVQGGDILTSLTPTSETTLQ